MPNKINITGKKFGKWTVIKESNKKYSQVLWVCKCDCGTIKDVVGTGLRNGRSTSCGCTMEEYSNIKGKKFGKWTVIKKSKEIKYNGKLQWVCRCECGNISLISGSILRYGRSKSCVNCNNKIFIKNILGQKFGTWTVIEEAGRTRDKTVIWLCKCQCGTVRKISGNALRAGYSKHCGCLRDRRIIFRKDKESNRQLAIFKQLYANLRSRNNKCKNKNLVSFDDFISLSKCNCYYCNAPPFNIAKDSKPHINKDILYYTGLDQVIAGSGYSKNNIVPCCINCNRIKNILSKDDFKNLVINIYNNWAKYSFGNIILLYQHGEIIGKKIDKLTVINKHSKNEWGNSIWNCRCDCGNYLKLATHLIRTGRITSCGCRPMNHIVFNDRKFVILRHLYSHIKHSKNNHNHTDVIDFETFEKLSYSNCFYCGCLPHRKHIDKGSKYSKSKIKHKAYIYTNGIDRINSSEGYGVGNVRSCCHECNIAKNKLHEDQFKQFVINIYNHWASK